MTSVIPVKTKGVLAALFLFANYSLNGWYTAHFWSLSVEEHFYLFWPSVMARFSRRSRVMFALALVIFVGLLRAVVLHNSWHLDEPTMKHFLQHTEARADYLMYGCLAAIALQSEKIFKSFKKFIGHGGWLLLFIAFGCLTFLGSHTGIDPRSGQAILLAAIVSGTVVAPRTLLGRFLELRPLCWIGRLSYSIYLWQQLFLHSSGAGFHARLMWLPIKVTGILAIASLSYYFVERPMMALGRSIAERKASVDRDGSIDVLPSQVTLTGL
jgi:peptidoglycan/LPS O-acetylase OafA/YrhL